jgi:hypothetical protein
MILIRDLNDQGININGPVDDPNPLPMFTEIRPAHPEAPVVFLLVNLSLDIGIFIPHRGIVACFF